MNLYVELEKYNENLVEFFVYDNNKRIGTVYYSFNNGKYKGGIKKLPEINVIGDIDESFFKDLSNKKAREIMEAAENIMNTYKK